MSKFILKNVRINDRHIEPLTIGEIPKQPIWEEMNITLNFISSGNTKDFTNDKIINQIFRLIGELNAP